jgi:hypothetical protein
MPEKLVQFSNSWWQDKELLRAHGGVLRRLRETAVLFFTQAANGKQYQRRPNLSITLPCDGDPPAKLVIRPAWSSKSWILDVATLQAELVVERIVVDNLTRPTVEVSLRLMAEDKFSCRPCSITWAKECCDRLAATAAAFLDDPFAAFAKSANICCICRRKLTDEVSRSRGIGPECLKHATFFRRLVEQRLVEQRECQVELTRQRIENTTPDLFAAVAEREGA